MRCKLTLLFFAAVLCWSAVAHAQQWSGILDPSRAIDWSSAGVSGGIPNRTTICATLNPGATAAQINNAIASCPSGQVVYLNAGTYTLNSGVTFGSTSNVTLRGAGADQTLLIFNSNKDGAGNATCGLYAVICISNNHQDRDGVQNSATWTGTTEGGAGVYPKGATHVTLSSTTNLAAGGTLILDQHVDAADGWPAAGGIFVCDSTSCTGQGGGNSIRIDTADRGQSQIVEVTAVNGSTVTITPGLTMPNWRTDRSPGAWWPNSSQVLHDDGIENLSLEGTTATHCGTCANIVMFNVRNCWMKGVRSIEDNTTGGQPLSSHIWLNLSQGITIRDSYFYGGDNSSQSYGVQTYGSVTSLLVENNIFQHVSAPIVENGPSTGNVFAYNFAIDDNWTNAGSNPGWMQPMAVWHEVGESMELYEGNSGLGTQPDNIHGTHHFGTFFRNLWYGDIWNNPAKDGNTPIIHLWRYVRFFNAIGNVLGRASYYTDYETGDDNSIFSVNGDPDPASPNGTSSDARTKATLMRWGNWDTVNNATRWLCSEVPTGITNYSNACPGTNGQAMTLPNSFYLSAKPTWWGSVPWPPIGPDVSGGNASVTVSGTTTTFGGHGNRIPAENCWYNTMGGVVGSSGLLSFNAVSCYGQSGGSVPSAPSNLRVQ